MTPLVAFTAAWAFGIMIAQAALFSPLWVLPLLPVAATVHFGWRHDRRAQLVIWALVGLLLGVGRYQLLRDAIDAGHVALYNDAGELTFTGVVVREPDRRDTYTNLRVASEQVYFGEQTVLTVHGDVLIKAPTYTAAFYGDRVIVTGTLETPPAYDGFSYKDYLARQGVYSIVPRAAVTVTESHQANRLLERLLRFKRHALETLLALLPEPQASLLAGILLGVETGIPEDLNDAFAATGTSHIVAISGFNLTIVAGVWAALARRMVGRRAELPMSLSGIWLYTLLVGGAAAVSRAAVMASVALVARHAGRRVHGPTSLAAAVLAMSAWNPHILWDLGFQLSLAATVGLVLYADPLAQAFTRFLKRFARPERAERIVGWLNDALIVTLAAQLTTTILIVARFQRLSLITLITNFLILPAQSFLMASGGLALAAGLIWLPLGQALGWLAWVFLTYTIEIVNLTARVPLASTPMAGITLPVVWGYYAVLGLASWWWSLSRDMRRLRLERLRALPAWQLAAAGALVIVTGGLLVTRPDGQLHVHVLDVEKGDAILIETPAGQQVLVDGGGDAARTLSQLGRHMPFWDRRLDGVICTSPDDERLGGLIPVLERYRVHWVVVGPEIGSGDRYERWQSLLDEREAATVTGLWSGSTWDLDTGVTLHVLWPPSSETSGPLVMHLTHGDVRVLLAGDATTIVEEGLVMTWGDALRAHVLLTPRHGARTAATPAFLQAVRPETALVSVGGEGASAQVLARLLDVPVFRTDLHGSIEVVSDGVSFDVRTARQSE
ncbi:MAG: ComEC/Rec2 family competence protein [Anaerolineae bacterium]|nr:ComEC/Rec2 family competence protein [Anaerolineae bacterium]